MASFLLFATVLAFVLAALFFLGGLDVLLNPFKDRKDFAIGFGALLFAFPLIFVAGETLRQRYVNYCTPIEPIAAPDLADVRLQLDEDGNFIAKEVTEPVVLALLEENAALQVFLDSKNAEIHSLNNELAVNTIALDTARAKIVELEARIKTLEAVRIQAPTPTPTPISRPKQCRRGGCN